MILDDLIRAVKFENLIPYLLSTMKNKTEEQKQQNLLGYREVFTTLHKLDIDTSDFTTVLILEKGIEDTSGETWEEVDGDDFKYIEDHPELIAHWWISVSGRNFDNPADTDYYALELCPWERWLGFVVRMRDLRRFGPDDYVAACLWEMTFFGYSKDAIQTVKQELNDQYETLKNLPKDELLEHTTSIEDLLCDIDKETLDKDQQKYQEKLQKRLAYIKLTDKVAKDIDIT